MAELVAVSKTFVSFAVEHLGNSLVQEYRFLHGVRAQVEEMQRELSRMQCFLKAVDARQEGDERVRNCISEIRELSFDAEDVIATYVNVAFRRRNGMPLMLTRYFCIFKESRARHRVGSDIEDMNRKIANLTRSLQTYGVQPIATLGESSTSRSERDRQLRQSYAHDIEDDIVGLDEDVKQVVDQIVNENTKCRVVAIWGMGGLGKTTLAKMVYHHSDVRRHFDSFAWVYISQQCKTREVLEEILINLLSPISKEERQEIEKLKLSELAKKLHEVQSKKKCFVILDDIWKGESWDSLRPGFPNSNVAVGSKILITTRIREVALDVDQQCVLHELRLLTEKESWELFQKKTSLRRAECRLSTEMMKLGEDMVKHCGGLPLAIVVLGGLLATKHTLSEWEKVSRNVDYLRKGKGPGGVPVTSVLALSYNDLPYHLKACFLCLSDLPEDKGVRPKKLIQKWMAEGFVSLPAPARIGARIGEVEETMLDVGMSYLDELYQRCMIQVGQLTRCSRRVKFYRLHDLMRDLCLLKAQEENFGKVVFMGEEDSTIASSSSSSSTKIRRLTMYLGYKPVGDGTRNGYINPHKMDEICNHHHVRSCQFYFFGNPLEDSDWRHIKSIFKGFKLLRYLDLEGTTFSGGKKKRLPKEVGNLIHLRYLSIRDSWIVGLPSSLGNLGFLQTLDLRARANISIANVLWRLEQLRHLYLPNSIKKPFFGKLRLDGLRKLETLEGFDSRDCDVRCFSTLTNLRKLEISYAFKKDLAVILKSPILSNSNRLLRYSSFKIWEGFGTQEEQSLQRQLLGCRHLHKLILLGHLSAGLPDELPPNLTKLTLFHSRLEEDPMSKLEKLPNLRSLNLSVDAYIGKEMVCSAPTPTTTTPEGGGGGFPQLKLLKLEGLSKLEEWRVEDGAMPGLLRLEIKYCRKLKEIPCGLRFVSSLREFVFLSAFQELRDRVKEGGEDFYKVQHVPSITIMECCYSLSLIV